MSLSSEAKAQIIGGYQRSSSDTGSSEVQVALITNRIRYLTEHLKVHKNDKHTRLGLRHLVARRRKLLDYLKRTRFDVYQSLLGQLEIRR